MSSPPCSSSFPIRTVSSAPRRRPRSCSSSEIPSSCTFWSSMLASEASRLVGIAQSHVTREYPNKLDHVLSGPEDLRGPRALHPVFYGSFDWHSCVHSYWLL